MHLTERGLERQFGARTSWTAASHACGHSTEGFKRGRTPACRLSQPREYVQCRRQHHRAMCPYSLESLSLSISETADEVVVHHADRLHVRIDDGRTDEAESAPLEILAERVGLA